MPYRTPPSDTAPAVRVARVELRPPDGMDTAPLLGVGNVEQGATGARLRGTRPPVRRALAVAVLVGAIAVSAAVFATPAFQADFILMIAFAAGFLVGPVVYLLARRHLRRRPAEVLVRWSALRVVDRAAPGRVTLRFSDRGLRGDVELVALDEASASIVDEPWAPEADWRCAMCGQERADVGFLVSSATDALLCDACVFKSVAALSTGARRLVRRRVIERTCAAWADKPELAAVCTALGALLADLPPDTGTDRTTIAGHGGRQCMLCRGWAVGWEGVTTDGVSVCGRCVAESGVTMTPSPVRRIELVLATHEASARNAETGPLLALMLAVAAGADELRQVADAAEDYSHSAMARDALERIPSAERTTGDAFTLAYHHAYLGDPQRALELHRAIDTAIEDDYGRGVWLLNEASYALDAGLTDPDELGRRVKQLEEARARLVGAPEPERLRYVPMTYQHLAAIHLRQDRLDDASTALDVADTIAPSTPDRLELRGKILARRGDRAGAETAWRRALEEADPDGPLAGRLRNQLGIDAS